MVKLFVEGGGDSNALRTACREGFTTFITRAGLTRRPRVVACGSRRDAFDSFRTEVAQGDEAMLLVDSEAPVFADCQQPPADPMTWMPWAHLGRQPGDGWEKPRGSADTDCHLMIQCMETWFLADRAVLSTFFNPGFRSSELPPTANSLESIAKSDVYDALRQRHPALQDQGRLRQRPAFLQAVGCHRSCEGDGRVPMGQALCRLPESEVGRLRDIRWGLSTQARPAAPGPAPARSG